MTYNHQNSLWAVRKLLFSRVYCRESHAQWQIYCLNVESLSSMNMVDCDQPRAHVLRSYLADHNRRLHCFLQNLACPEESGEEGERTR
jgi:hypothetical protein